MQNQDQIFLFNRVRDYINQSLSQSDQTQFEDVLKKQKMESMPDQYRTAVGSFQTALHGFYLDQAQVDELTSLMEDTVVRRTTELRKIEGVDPWDLALAMRRRVFWLVVLSMVAGLGFYFLRPKREIKFNALQYVAYEALAMEENPKSRLDLPSESFDEIKDFLERHPGLGFTPTMLGPIGADWKPEGVVVIDYDTVKVSAIQYFSSIASERMFVFSYPAKLSDLPKTEVGLRGVLKYQAYSSEQLNLVAWQSSPDTVSFVVGRRSASDLSGFAQSAKNVSMKVK